MNKEAKRIEVNMTYTKKIRNGEAKISKEASVEFGTETNLKQIEMFFSEFADIVRSYKYCAKQAIYCEVFLSSNIYEHDGENVISKSFDGWFYKGVPEYGCKGLYLSPDTKYTKKEHDIWIAFSRPLMKELAEAGI